MNSEVAIIIPVYQEALSKEQNFSITHLEHYLGGYPWYILAPETLAVPWSNHRVIRFPDFYFRDRNAYSKLLLCLQFYRLLELHDFVLIYQLDCLVFSDELTSWCKKGYDYIGAPLFKDKHRPQRGFSRVGNGGFSLRRVDAFLKVLTSSRVPSWKEVVTTPLPDLYKFSLPYRWLKKLRVFREARRGVQWYTKHYSLNEDLFWSDRAKLFYPEFKIAPIEVALRFAFEAHPRYCYKQNGYRLPFGCHAWAKWDRAFWEPFLLKMEAR